MKKIGRKKGFVLASFYSSWLKMAVVAIYQGWFWLFLLSAFMLGPFQYRFAAVQCETIVFSIVGGFLTLSNILATVIFDKQPVIKKDTVTQKPQRSLIEIIKQPICIMAK